MSFQSVDTVFDPPFFSIVVLSVFFPYLQTFSTALSEGVLHNKQKFSSRLDFKYL